MPIRGHSNVQGIGSVGVTPSLKEALFERLYFRAADITAMVQDGVDIGFYLFSVNVNSWHFCRMTG